MNFGPNNKKIGNFIPIALALQLAFLLSVFADIPVARQLLGFINLTFVMGFVVLKLLKPNNLSAVRTVLFSIGLSIALLMLIGLTVNEIGSFIGLERPLDPIYLIPATSGVILFGIFLNFLRFPTAGYSIKMKKAEAFRFLLVCSVPVLSVVGAFWANVTGNSFILLVALIADLFLFLTALFLRRLFTPRLRLLVIFILGLTLLFHYSLISSYVQGPDIKLENYVFTSTLKDGYWNSSVSFADMNTGRFNNMLSITVLPTLYSNVLNLDSNLVLKLIFPAIFALVPVALYVLWRDKFGAKVGFLSAFLLVSQTTFYVEMPALARQMIAEVFVALLLILLFTKKSDSKSLKIFFVILGFSLIVSHYAMALVFDFFILAAWLFAKFAKKTNRNVSLSLILLFNVMMLLWYVFTSASAGLESIVTNLSTLYTSLGDFFNVTTRGQGVLEGLGLVAAPSTLNLLSRSIAYIIEFFIIVGFVVLILRWRKGIYQDSEYFFLCSANILLLGLCIVVPSFANRLQITRFFHIMLFILAPLFVMGFLFSYKFVWRRLQAGTKRKMNFVGLVLIALLLGTYFLFQTNIMYEVTGSQSWSLPLSRYRLGTRLYTEFFYTTEYQVNGAKWLQNSIDTDNNILVYYSGSTYGSCIAYGGIRVSQLRQLTNFTLLKGGEFIVLGEDATVYGIIEDMNTVWNVSEIINSQPLSSQPLNLLYTNGNCVIFQNQDS